MIHLYAFRTGSASLPAVRGIGGQMVEPIVIGDVVAVVGRLDELEPTRDAVLIHGLVVEAVCGVSDAVLPARFGECYASEEELRSAIAGRLPALRERLAAVRGCVELGVRVLAEPDATPTSAGDGKEYMRTRLASLAQADAVAAELHEPLSCHAQATVVSPGDGHVAAYLVSVEERSAFEEVVARFAAAHPNVTVVCTGPWAPYSFAEAA